MGLFSWIGNILAMPLAGWTVRKHPVLRAALYRSSQIFNETGLKKFSDESKQTMAENLLERIAQIVESDDKISKCRSDLTASVLDFAKYQVLVLPPYPEEDATELRGTQGVSGELKPLLLDVAEKNKEIRELMYGITKNPTYENVWDTILILYWRSYWWTETFDACRIELDDYNHDVERDWYKPFIHSQCVFSEHLFREDLGLGPAPEISDKHRILVPLEYSTFFNFVLEGVRYPDLAWREHYMGSIEDGTLVPPFPK